MNQLATRLPVTQRAIEDEYWQATEHRDQDYDGKFVYAVRSTGIYCRPTCPSRRPRRDRVLFFDTCSKAERAGFRACKRCHPTAAAPGIAMVRTATEYIDTHLDEPITLALLGAACGISPHHLQRTFKRLTGLTPHQYVRERRLDRMKDHLRSGSDVTTALYGAGFGSSSRLYENSAGRLGMTPKTYRDGGAGVQINYTILDSQLGQVLIGTTAKGICAVYLGDSDEDLEDVLRSEYPAASLRRGAQLETRWMNGLKGLLDGHALSEELPLDLQATAFQWRVWSFLQGIPVGETRSYAQVAKGIGQPSAARAVARACASNPVALIVPCHRVVRADGQTGDYRWGRQRKQALLDQEYVAAAS